MLKKCLLFLILFSTLPIFAGELENAMKMRDNVFLYLYSPSCRYCKEFMPSYNKLSKMYDSKFAFVKLDTSTDYGYSISKKYNTRYVPYVRLINKNKSVYVPATCLAKYACVENAIKKF